MMAGLTLGFFPVIGGKRMECGGGKLMHVRASSGFPSFLPKEVHQIKDPFARTLAQRIQRLPVQVLCVCVCVRARLLANVGF